MSGHRATDESTTDAGEVDWEAIERGPAYRRLRAMQRRYVVPVAVLVLGFYLAFLVVALTVPDALTARLFGGFNIAYGLMLVIFLLVWASVIGYVLLSNRRWDAQVAQVKQEAGLDGSDGTADSPSRAVSRRDGEETG